MRTLSLVLLFLTLGITLAAEGEKHALLIGVKEYTDPELPQLQYAENDATELADVLKQQGYVAGNIHLLTVSNAFDTRTDNLRPTAKNIRIWLNYINKNARPNDSVLIAFAGHGIELKDPATNKFRPFFCPLEASLKDEKTLIAINDLYEALDQKCLAHVKVLVMDACRTSRFSRDASVTMPLIPDPPGGIVAFFSCGKGQKSYESDTFKHGIFFHFFLAGLKGACANPDGEVTVPLLEDYLTRNVPRTAVQEQKNPEADQMPERRGQVLGQVVLSKLAAAPKPPPVPTVSAEELEKIREEARRLAREEELQKIKNEQAAAIKRNGSDAGKTLTLNLPGGVKMELVRIPKGTFTMGDKDDGPAHEVTITKDYYMGKYHVTQEQYQAVMGTNPSRFKGDQNPVEEVSWDDAVAFCAKLSQLSGKQIELPTEAQWEKACRAGTTTKFYTGDSDEDLARAGWYDKNSDDKSHPVGQKVSNSYGLYDMHGNVWQWCKDWYTSYNAGAQTDPTGPTTGTTRVLRGGSWGYYPSRCRSAYRGSFTPDFRLNLIGFRIVLPLDFP
ncbi:MAG: SUMF1/EgtB/PvdO family nonheme iron enzyme [Planctomycetota bacterium]